ncbi:hypothetical protein K2F40_06520 [Clostridium sp. CM028]|uniref:hypothetical protein n=1 Tax=Clostridium sp. CM028 TaxID=2851575 RepID=UPI001C6DF107|nr:hypothetical protein [Clostridium sp. CM028]MBW9148617.1 hypothetical protein [Clostridium sp. CM028]WLC60791.1 hypothetical protein KTC94_11640 [Clostridium sp. CM028]
MNGEIIKKLIRIEKLKYEVIKDVLPEKILHKINNFEKEAIILIKDIGLHLINEGCEKAEEEANQEIKKVKVDFL